MKRKLPARSLCVLTTLIAGAAVADQSAPRVERFIGCPVYRDTDAGRKSGCWLADDPATGIRYDVTGGRIKPILGQLVLVEGAVSSLDKDLCGGVVLQPVNVSVLPQPCKQHLIPAEGHPGRRFALPARVMQPTDVPRTLPPPPYTTREYTIEFELNSDFLVYQYSETILEDAALYIKASKPKRVVITGYAGLDEVIKLLARRQHGEGDRVRLLFGNEPFPSRQRTWVGPDISAEVREHWLRQGISVALCASVIRARALVEHDSVEVRIARAHRPVHSKIYATEHAITLGSSNFTSRGLGDQYQAEGNVRFESGSPARLSEARLLAEGQWSHGWRQGPGRAGLVD